MSVGTVKNKWDTSHTELQSNLETSLHQTTGKQPAIGNKDEKRSKASFAQIATSIAKANMIVRSIGLNKKGAGSPTSITEDQLPGESFVNTLPQAELARVNRLISEQTTAVEQQPRPDRFSTQATPAANTTREAKRFMATARDFRLTSNYPKAASHRPKRSDAKTSSDTLPQQAEVPSLKRIGASKPLATTATAQKATDPAYLSAKTSRLQPKGSAATQSQHKVFMQTFSGSRPNKLAGSVVFAPSFADAPSAHRGSKLFGGPKPGAEVSEKGRPF